MQTGSGVVLRFGLRNIQNDVRIKSCIERYDNDAYSRLQFLNAVSHSLSAHTEAFLVTTEDDSDRDADAPSGVCPVVRRSTCPKFQLLGLGLGQDLSEHLWGSEFFCTLDDFG